MSSGLAMRPRSELDNAPVITTSTKRPISDGGPEKLTVFMFSVFPANSAASLRDRPSTRIRFTSLVPAVVIPAYFALIHYRFVLREEPFMAERLGAAYDAYRKRVRRWL